MALADKLFFEHYIFIFYLFFLFSDTNYIMQFLLIATMPVFGIPIDKVMQQQSAKYPDSKIPHFLITGFKYIIRNGNFE